MERAVGADGGSPPATDPDRRVGGAGRSGAPPLPRRYAPAGTGGIHPGDALVPEGGPLLSASGGRGGAERRQRAAAQVPHDPPAAGRGPDVTDSLAATICDGDDGFPTHPHHAHGRHHRADTEATDNERVGTTGDVPSGARRRRRARGQRRPGGAERRERRRWTPRAGAQLPHAAPPAGDPEDDVQPERGAT